MYKFESEDGDDGDPIKTNATLQEKFITSLRERLAFKRSKRKQLDADLNVIKRESRVAFEDLKDYIKNLKTNLKAADEVDAGPKSPELKSQEEFNLRRKSHMDSLYWKKLRRMLREETRPSSFQPHDSETDNE